MSQLKVAERRVEDVALPIVTQLNEIPVNLRIQNALTVSLNCARDFPDLDAEFILEYISKEVSWFESARVYVLLDTSRLYRLSWLSRILVECNMWLLKWRVKRTK